jgi:DNA-binding MarR family transcriptional regulator
MSIDAAPADGVLDDIPHGELVELSARFAHAFLRYLDTSLSDGVTYPGLRLLQALHCNGPAKMVTLAEGLGLSARNMTALADALEAEGLVRRTAHPTDRRAILLELTPTGLAAADESLAPRLAALGRLFDELSPAARAGLAKALTTLVAAIEPPTCPDC